MTMQKTETLHIQSSMDIVLVRQAARQMSVEIGFSLVDQTKFVTAASELARNTLEYGGGGTVKLETLQEERRRGLRLIFEDRGPGIPNIELALKDGFTTGSGLGMGLSGAKRLASEFEIQSAVGQGTRVTIIKWK